MITKDKKDKEAIRAVGYIRASTREQVLTPHAQRQDLEAWAEENGAHLVAVYEDLGVSGSKGIDKRPGLLDCIEALSRERASIMLVSKRDRLSRDVYLTAMIEHLVERERARVMSADGTGNGDQDDIGDIVRKVIDDLFAMIERKKIIARTRAALAIKRSRGEKLGGHRPFGFHVLDGDVKRLVEDDSEQATIAVIVSSRDQGQSYHQIARDLNAQNIPTATGSTWFPQTVKNVYISAGS